MVLVSLEGFSSTFSFTQFCPPNNPHYHTIVLLIIFFFFFCWISDRHVMNSWCNLHAFFIIWLCKLHSFCCKCLKPYILPLKYMSKSFDRCHMCILELLLFRFIELAHITSSAKLFVGYLLFRMIGRINAVHLY